MNVYSQLVPAHTLAIRNGIKLELYGPPGSGKTPLLNTLSEWRPIICAGERNYLAMAGSQIPTFRINKPSDYTDFAKWASTSKEAEQFGVKCLDSVSQMGEDFLTEANERNKDGRAAYGVMSDKVAEVLDQLFDATMNLVLIAHESREPGQKRPWVPGKELDRRVPHKLSWVARLGYVDFPNGRHRVIQNKESVEHFARESSDKLQQYEAPDLGVLFNKLLA